MSTAELHPERALAFLKASRTANHGRTLGDRLYSMYLAAFATAIAGFLSYASLRNKPFSAKNIASIQEIIPFLLSAGFCLVFIGVMRFATWQGPVSFSRPDIPFLLVSPLSRRALVRPKLIHALLFGLGSGMLLGLALFGFLQAKLLSDAGPLLGATLMGPGLFGVLVAALSWHVESSINRARTVASWGWILFVAAFVMGIGIREPSETRSFVALWSGPWGWASSPIVAAVGGEAPMWPFTTALLAVAAAVAAVSALKRADAATTEELARRAGLRSGLSAALYVQDFRGLAKLGHEAKRALFAPRKRKIRRPKRALLVVPWRDALALLRAPSRVIWSATLLACSALLSSASGGHPAAVALAIVLAYLAAGRLVETVRQEADDPDASSRLPWTFGDVILMHTLVPSVVFSLLGSVAIGLYAIDGVIPSSLVAPFIGVVILAATMLVFCAAGIGQRGRPPLELLFMGGGEAMFMWHLVGPILALITIGIPVAAMIGNTHQGLPLSQAAASAAFFLALDLAVGIMILRRRRPKTP